MTVWSSCKILTTYCKPWQQWARKLNAIFSVLVRGYTQIQRRLIIELLETFFYFKFETFIIKLNWLPEMQNVSKYSVKRPNFVSCTFLCPILGIFVASIINKLQVFTVGNQILRSFERWNPMKKIEKTTKCQSQVSVLLNLIQNKNVIYHQLTSN